MSIRKIFFFLVMQTLITLDRREVDEASDLAVSGVESNSSSLHSDLISSNSFFAEKSRTILLSLSMTTLPTRLVTSAMSVCPDLFSP